MVPFGIFRESVSQILDDDPRNIPRQRTHLGLGVALVDSPIKAVRASILAAAEEG